MHAVYGLVNRAIEGMVAREHGAAAWGRILERAGVGDGGFVSNESYPDDTTYRIVAAAAQVLEKPADAILFAFGEYWVLNTALESYGPLMRAAGRTAAEFLLHLPNFHRRVRLIYPSLQPPMFECSDVGTTSLQLHYRSTRPAGLESFVEGLISGIGKMFDTPLATRRLADRSRGDDHSVFLVSW